MSVLSFRRLTTTAEPVSAGDATITPEARAWVVRLPFGGVVWHRPVAVRVERGGRIERIRILDLSGWLVALFTGLTLVATALLLVTSFRHRRKNRE